MLAYRLGGTMVSHSKNHTLTLLPDDRELRSDHSVQPGQEKTASELGLDAMEMNELHDLTHSLLAAMLGLRESPTLSHVARGETWEHWYREEAAVLALQAYAKVVGVDLRDVALRLSAASFGMKV